MPSLRENVSIVSDPRHLDASIEEVFDMMLGVACRRVADREASSEAGVRSVSETLTAMVGFGGLLSGACVLEAGESEALIIAGKLAGMEFLRMDDTVKDALGELCNMLAGTWKAKVPELAANCGLSIPAVITGDRYCLHVQAPEFRLDHTFCFDNTYFHVTIICDGLE